MVTLRIYRNQSVFREFIAAKMEKTTAGGEQSNFAAAAAAAAAAACLINVDGLYSICRE